MDCYKSILSLDNIDVMIIIFSIGILLIIIILYRYMSLFVA